MEDYLLLIFSFALGYYFHRYIKKLENEFLSTKMTDAKLLYEKKLSALEEEYPKVIAKKTEDLTREHQEKLTQLENEKINYQKKIQNLGLEYDDMCRTLEQTFSKKENDLEKTYNEKTELLQKLFNQKTIEIRSKLNELDNSQKQEFSLSQAKEEKKLIEKKMAVYSALKHKEEDISRKEVEISNQLNEIQKQREALETRENYLNEKASLLNKKISDIPALSAMYADIAQAKEDAAAYYLANKRNPGHSSAAVVQGLKREMRLLRLANKNLEYKLLTYESLFPVLKDYEDEPLNLKPDPIEYDDKKGDRVHYWVKPTEYMSLSVTERNQRALDRYWNRNKTHIEIGTDYERSIGYWEYERKGWKVSYFGINKGLEDLGRDLICVSPDKKCIHIVQCKCWSSKKRIHENHINQLFGTTVRYFLEHCPSMTIEDFCKVLEDSFIVPVFYTTTCVSETAKSFAKSLGIQLHEEVPLKIYPMIKCNISQRTGERIYHLPFDQQYDNIKIDPPNEFIALTVEEAEHSGFRRAFRWHSS